MKYFHCPRLSRYFQYNHLGVRDGELTLWNTVLQCCGRCTNLRRLTCDQIVLSEESCMALCDSKITDLSFLHVRLRLANTKGSIKLNTGLLPLANLTDLKSFRFTTENPSSTADWLHIDTFLCRVAEKWRKLRCFMWYGFHPISSHTFVQITSAWSQLQVLGLYGEKIKDGNITLIAKHLKKLTCLMLVDGDYTPSGVKKLCGHPSIEKLHLLQNNQEHTAIIGLAFSCVWCHSISSLYYICKIDRGKSDRTSSCSCKGEDKRCDWSWQCFSNSTRICARKLDVCIT